MVLWSYTDPDCMQYYIILHKWRHNLYGHVSLAVRCTHGPLLQTAHCTSYNWRVIYISGYVTFITTQLFVKNVLVHKVLKLFYYP